MSCKQRNLLALSCCCLLIATVGSSDLTPRVVARAARQAERNLAQRRARELSVVQDIAAQAGSRVNVCPHVSLSTGTANNETARRADMGRIFEETAAVLVSSGVLANISAFAAVSLPPSLLELRRSICRAKNINCDPQTPYRTADGTCNNLNYVDWGSAGSCMRRLLPPAYKDGIREPRAAKSGRPLPNARRISFMVHQDVSVPDPNMTHLVMQMGQFLAHDFSLAPVEAKPGDPGSPLDCCLPSMRNFTGCYPISIPPGDPFYTQFGVQCMSFIRSAPCPQCVIGPRQQKDDITSYIDASQIYGSSSDTAAKLRLFQDGLMKFQAVDDYDLLPRSLNPDVDRCGEYSLRDLCFMAGDERVNQHPALTSLHTLWLRQHNRVARELKRFNPTCDDEKLYKETRRIIGAQLQHVTYQEWLPVLIGPVVARENGLVPLQSGFTTYDPTVDATMINEFAAAAYRLGHSLIDGKFTFANGSGEDTNFLLKNKYFFPFDFYHGAADPIIRGLDLQNSQEMNRFLTTGVTNYLYQIKSEPYGADLAAVDIQRGRDHGLRPYVDYVKYCGGPPIVSFESLKDRMSAKVAAAYAELYEDVADIDLFTAAISEYHIPGCQVGPTIACIIGKMFHKMKYGDRFYYEHGNQAGSFTEAQLTEIKKTTSAQLLCDNVLNTIRVQRNTFRPFSEENPVIDCRQFARPDFNKWHMDCRAPK